MHLRIRNFYNQLNLTAKSISIFDKYFDKYNKKNKTRECSNYVKRLQLSHLNKLFISYLMIVIICVGCMALFSYRLERENIKNWAIKSNNELLNNFKNTIDSFVFDSVNKLSLIVLQNAITNSDLSFYFLNSVEGHYSDLTKVCSFLNNIRATNPLISSLSIYYKSNDLLVTTDGIKYSSNDHSILPDRSYIRDLYDSDVMEYWGLKKEILATTSDEEHVYIAFVRKISPPASESKSGGSIAIAVDENMLHTVIKSSAPVAFGQIFIVDEEGQIVSHNEKKYLFSNINNMPYGKYILKSINKSDYFITKIDNVDSIVSYVTSDFNSWKYITVQPIAELVKSRLNFLGRTILLITVVTLLFGLFASFISTRKIYSPLRNLLDLCKNVVKFRSPSISKDEYGIIGSTLDILSERVKEQEKKMEQSIPIIKHHFIQNLLNSSYYNGEIIFDKMEFLGISFYHDYFRVITLKLAEYPPEIDFKIYEMVKLDVMEKIGCYFTGYSLQNVCTEGSNTLNIILNIKTEDVDILQNSNKLLKYIENDLNLHVNMGIGNAYRGLENIKTSFKEAELCLSYSYIYPELGIFTMCEVSNWIPNSGETLRPLYDAFCDSIKYQDKKGSTDNISKLIYTIRKDQICYNQAMKTLTQCVAFIEDTIAYLKINPDYIIQSDIYTDFNNINNILELEKWFNIVINQIFTQIAERKSERNSDFIKEVQDFISANILEPSISLNYVADAMHISPTYLSRMFKQETGTNFVEYLMDSKLNAAKEILLLNENMKIEDLCARVGYSSPQYFIRKFKGKYGATPGEYRATYLREEAARNGSCLTHQT